MDDYRSRHADSQGCDHSHTIGRAGAHARKPLSYGRLSPAGKADVDYKPRLTSRVPRLLIFLASSLAVVLLLSGSMGAQNLGTIGTGTAGESTAKGAATTPNGPAPRLPNGHPDFSGVWDHAYVPDMT